MRFVVTGASGFIGSHTVDALLGAGHEVVGVDCLIQNYDSSIKSRNLDQARQYSAFRSLPLDLAVDDLSDLAECDFVIHLAGQPGVRKSWGNSFPDYLRNNVLATQRLLEVCSRNASLRRLVMASSSSIYGESNDAKDEAAMPRPFSPYGVTKLAAEQLVFAYEANRAVPAIALRYFTVYGPRQRPDMAIARFICGLLRGDSLEIFGDGSQMRDFTFVADVVRATLLAAFADDDVTGFPINIAGGSSTSVREVIDVLEGISGVHCDRNFLQSQEGDVSHTEASTDLALAALDWKPAFDLYDGLVAQFEWATRKR